MDQIDLNPDLARFQDFTIDFLLHFTEGVKISGLLAIPQEYSFTQRDFYLFSEFM